MKMYLSEANDKIKIKLPVTKETKNKTYNKVQSLASIWNHALRHLLSMDLSFSSFKFTIYNFKIHFMAKKNSAHIFITNTSITSPILHN